MYKKSNRFFFYAVSVCIFWTATILLIYWFLRSDIHLMFMNTTNAVARASFEKDVLYRQWAAAHGGVYVPVTKRTLPNPNLSHIPERDIVTPSGRKLTLINPAYMTRQVYEDAKNFDGVRGHITSLKPIRKENAPDAWEKKALLAFERGSKEVSSVEDMEGKPYLRLMRPFMVAEPCMKCHASQGYKVGDVRGGVSVSVPLAPYLAVEEKEVRELARSLFGIWLTGLLLIIAGSYTINKRTAERRLADEKVRDLNRVYAVLSSVNQLIIRAPDQRALFDGICSIAIENGGFAMAWVGLVDAGARSARPVASSGRDDGFLEAALTNGPDGMGPMYDAVMSGRHFICGDLGDEACTIPWRDEALKRGYRSLAVFPVRPRDVTVAIITFHSDSMGFFDSEEVRLLDELAADTSFSLWTIEQEILHKQAEENVKQSEQKFRTMFDEATDGILLVDLDNGVFHDGNKTICDMLGYSLEEIKTLGVSDIHPEESLPYVMEQFERQMSRDVSLAQDLPIKRNDGSVFYADVNSTHIVLDGKTFMMGIFRDITERKQAESALRASQNFLETIVNTEPECVKLLSPDGELLMMNKAGLDMIEADSFEQVKGKSVYGLIAPEHREAFKALGEKVCQGGSGSLEFDMIGLKGRRRRLDTHSVPLRNENNEIIAVLGVTRDITVRKQAEDALRSEVAVTGALLEAANLTSRNLVWEDVTGNVAGLVNELTAGIGVMIFQILSDGILSPLSSAGLSADSLKYFYTMRARVEDISAFKDVVSSKATLLLGRDDFEEFGLSGYSENLGIMDMLLTPIITRGEVVAVLCVNFDRLPTDPRVVKIIEGIAGQLGVVYDNSHLYMETQNKSIELARSLETLKVLSEIDKKILSTLDRDEMMGGALSQIRRVAPADVASVILLDEGAATLRVSYGWCLNIKVGDVIPFDQCPGYQTLNTGKALIRKNLAEETTMTEMDKVLLDGGIKSDVFVPIIAKGNGVGLLHIGSYRVAGFTYEDIRTIENLTNQLSIALENSRLLSDLEEMFISVVTALASAIDAKSPWTKGHSERVTKYALMIAERMGLNHQEMEELRLAGLLHDVGKIGLYDVILDKPGKLTGNEFEMVKKHPEAGANILKSIRQFRGIIPIILYHHERWDGGGYPAGLKGEDIPLLARILCAADAFDSMTADRPYRPSPGIDYAAEEFRRCSGTQFAPEVAEAFLDILAEMKKAA